MMSTAYAREHKAPIGVINGIGRSTFSLCFGIAPIGSITLGNARPWLPYVCFSAVAGLTFVCHLALIAKGGDEALPRRRPKPKQAA